MSFQLELACRFAIEQAKKANRPEITPDDLLLGCFRTISQFGIVHLGKWIFDLEELGMDWLACVEEKNNKVLYSHKVVKLLDLGTEIAHASGLASGGVEHQLAAFAGLQDGLMGQLKQKYRITSADWRAAVADLVSEPRGIMPSQPFTRSDSAAPREYLTPEEAADILAIHVQTVRAHVRSGKLPALRLAGERAIRIRRVDLEKVFEPVVQAD